jgi:hypothetical protein
METQPALGADVPRQLGTLSLQRALAPGYATLQRVVLYDNGRSQAAYRGTLQVVSTASSPK